MRIPLEWLKEYVEIDKKPQEIGESFTYLGLLLDKPPETYQANGYETPVLALEHRMDRSDWLSVIGCARDLAAFEKKELKIPPVHKEPGKKPEKDQVVDIKVKCPDLVRRFNTKVFRNIKVGPSPDWLKNRLEAYGIPSINNIVDVTNYVMVEYGQPMHAQDLAKMKAQEIVIRRAKDGETITTLLGENIKLTNEQFVLTQAGEATVIGGIVGGQTTGVDETTTDIVLDAGNYNQTNIRRSSRSLKINNETVLRYDKFLNPILAQHAMERAVYLILELAGGEYYENIDWYPDPKEANSMALTKSRLQLISGEPFPFEEASKILTDLGYEITSQTEEKLELKIPYFRTDVSVEDDLIADILRVHNYNNLSPQKINRAAPKEITPRIYKFEEDLRDHLTSLGLHEHITDPLVPKTEGLEQQIVLENALTSQKSALRTNITRTLRKVADLYEKHGIDEIKLFEIGKIYLQEGPQGIYDSYQEIRTLEVLNIHHKISVHENSKITKKILAGLLNDLGVQSYQMRKEDEKVNIYLLDNEDGKKVGEISSYGFSLQTKMLLEHKEYAHRVATEIPNYSTENISLLLDLKQPFGPIYEVIKNFDPHIIDLHVLEEYTGTEIGINKKTILVKVYYDTSDTQEIRNKLFNHLEKKLHVKHRE